MVWGCITRYGFGRLVLIEGIMMAKKYCSILKDGLLGTLNDQGMPHDMIIFQQDNDRKHTAAHTRAWLERQKIETLPWPPNSPDQNIIENIWALLERSLNQRPRRPTTKKALFSALQEEQSRLGQDLCDSLYESIPDRIQALKDARGRHTKYQLPVQLSSHSI